MESANLLQILCYVWILTKFNHIWPCSAQTEGDIGYDYSDAYADEYDDTVLAREPTFDVPILNVTVIEGQTAVLPCGINDLGKYKVSWVDHNAVPLTFDETRVIDDSRFSIERPFLQFWNLQIREVSIEDQGVYRCTINTEPVKSKVVMLHVKVPAKILDELSSDDTTVHEGDTVVLVCNVTGVPRPTVRWLRRPANSKGSEKESKMCKPHYKRPEIGYSGEVIIIQNVSRYCDDYYECIAENGVLNPVSRQIRVTVEFPPEIHMANKRIGQAVGLNTILECVITAFPQANNYWEKNGRPITSSTKHRLTAYDEGDHTITLSLNIYEIERRDYGEYKCVAVNALGKDEEIMYLHETPNLVPTTPVLFVPLPPKHGPTRPTRVTDERTEKSQKSEKTQSQEYNNINKVDYHKPGVAVGNQKSGSAGHIRPQIVTLCFSWTLATVLTFTFLRQTLTVL